MSTHCPFPHLYRSKSPKENFALTSTPAPTATDGVISGGHARFSIRSLLVSGLRRSRVLRIRSLSCTALAILVIPSGVIAAQAHAHLDHAVPAVASTIRIAPDKIELSFNEAVEPAFSSVEVIDQAGGHIELGKLMPGLDDTKTLRIAIKMTEPGVYWVLWQVLSVDTHRSTGNFTFTLAP